MTYDIILIGTSAGGIDALRTVLKTMRKPIPVPVLIVQHLSPQGESYLPDILSRVEGLVAVEAEEKIRPRPGCAYVAPPNYHLMVELDHTLSLSVDEKVCYARPSIDVLFQTAADAYGSSAVGIILTGANHDGASGLETVKRYGGYTIVQEPQEAYASEMPAAAIRATDEPDEILPLERIGQKLNALLWNDDKENGTEIR